MDKNKKIGYGVVGVIVLIAVFYGGVTYGKNQVATAKATFQNGAGRTRGAGGPGGFGGLTTGSILSKDAQSITVQMATGGSKIVFFTDKTTVAKTVDGTVADLSTGKNVVVMGTANTDGSISATSIQLRPAFTPRPTNTTGTTPTTQNPQ